MGRILHLTGLFFSFLHVSSSFLLSRQKVGNREREKKLSTTNCRHTSRTWIAWETLSCETLTSLSLLMTKVANVGGIQDQKEVMTSHAFNRAADFVFPLFIQDVSYIFSRKIIQCKRWAHGGGRLCCL